MEDILILNFKNNTVGIYDKSQQGEEFNPNLCNKKLKVLELIGYEIFDLSRAVQGINTSNA